MIFPDINLLIYAHDTGFKRHKECANWLESTINRNTMVCYSWHTLLGFMRIGTSLRMTSRPYSMSEAMNIVSGLLSRENAVILTPGDRHLEIFRKLVSESGVSGAKISDAHLAALAIEHGATLASADRDFRLFDGLKLINPLLDS